MDVWCLASEGLLAGEVIHLQKFRTFIPPPTPLPTSRKFCSDGKLNEKRSESLFSTSIPYPQNTDLETTRNIHWNKHRLLHNLLAEKNRSINSIPRITIDGNWYSRDGFRVCLFMLRRKTTTEIWQLLTFDSWDKRCICNWPNLLISTFPSRHLIVQLPVGINGKKRHWENVLQDKTSKPSPLQGRFTWVVKESTQIGTCSRTIQMNASFCPQTQKAVLCKENSQLTTELLYLQ